MAVPFTPDPKAVNCEMRDEIEDTAEYITEEGQLTFAGYDYPLLLMCNKMKTCYYNGLVMEAYLIIGCVYHTIHLYRAGSFSFVSTTLSYMANH